MFKKQDEFDNLIVDLTKKSSYPSDIFMKNLFKQNKPKFNFRFIKIAFYSIGIMFVILLGVNFSTNLSQSNKLLILSKVFANNLVSYPGKISVDDNNLKLVTENVSYTFGNAYEKCEGLIGNRNNYTVNSIVNYLGYKGNTIFIKQQDYSDEGNLIMYYLSNYKAMYQFNGGNYAVKLNTISEEKSDQSIEDIINEQKKLIDTYPSIENNNFVNYEISTENNYLKITNKYLYNCTSDSYTSILEVWMVDPNTYQIQERAQYINSENEENKVYQTASKFNVKNVQMDENLVKTFTFDFNVPVKERNLDVLWGKTVMDEINYLKENNLKVLIPNQVAAIRIPDPKGDYDYYDITINTSIPSDSDNDYYKDRAFYIKDELGDKIYKSVVLSDDSPSYRINSRINGNYFTYYYLTSSTKEPAEKISFSKDLGEDEIIIDDAIVKTRIYEIQSKSLSGDANCQYDCIKTESTYTHLFKYKNQYFRIFTYVKNPFKENDVKFNLYDPKDSKGLEEIKKLFSNRGPV